MKYLCKLRKKLSMFNFNDEKIPKSEGPNQFWN